MNGSASGFAGLSRRGLLDAMGVLEQRSRDAEVDKLLIAAEWAASNGPDAVHVTKSGQRGRVRMREYGGRGTPKVSSVAGAELAARAGRSTAAGDHLIADSLDLAHRLPRLWQRTLAGEVLSPHARHVASRTRHLSVEAAAYVDGRVADYADGRLSRLRFEQIVEASVTAADPAAAEAREAAQRGSRYAMREKLHTEGMDVFRIRTDAFGVAKIDATVGHIARILKDLGSVESENDRRATAAVLLADPAEVVKLLAAYAGWRDRPREESDLEDELALASDRGGRDEEFDTVLGEDDADPQGESTNIVAKAVDLWSERGSSPVDGGKPVIDWKRMLPTMTVFVHLYGGGVTQTRAGRLIVGGDRADRPDLVRMDGIGHATIDWLRGHLRLNPDQRVRLTPVLDIEGQAPVDAWEIPDRHRRAVRLMTPADCFPWGSATTNRSDGWRSMQIDHTTPWKPGQAGQSAVGNYGPLTQFHHNLKTHAGWQVEQPFPGIYIWRDPDGAFYLIDHTGTRRIDKVS